MVELAPEASVEPSFTEPEPTVTFAPVVEPALAQPEFELPAATDGSLWQPTWQPRVPTLTSLESEPEEPAAMPAATFDPFREPEAPVALSASLPSLTPWAPTPAVDTPTEQIATVEEVVAESYAPAAQEPTTDLPTASAFSPLPMLGSLNGTHHEAAVDAPTADEPAAHEPAPSLSSMPTLGSLTAMTPLNGHHAAETPAVVAHAPTAADLLGSLDSLTPVPSAHEANPYEPGELPAGLPKLASAPISMDDIGTNGFGVADPSGPWGGPAHNHAAVGIWEMVDDLLEDGKPAEQDLVGSGSGEKRRGWLRGKKG